MRSIGQAATLPCSAVLCREGMIRQGEKSRKLIVTVLLEDPFSTQSPEERKEGDYET